MATTLGKRVLFFRTLCGISQKELAARLGITIQHMSRIERCKSDPSLEILRKISKELNIDLCSLFMFSSSLMNDIPEEKYAPEHYTPPVRTGAVFINKQSGRMKWSNKMYVLLGFEPFTISSKLNHLLKNFHQDDQQKVREFIDQTSSDTKPEAIFVRYCKKGRERVFNLSFDESDQDTIVSVTDVTDLFFYLDYFNHERKKIEDYVAQINQERAALSEKYEEMSANENNLIQSLENYESIVRASQYPQAFISTDLKHQAANNSYCRMMGATVKNIVGQDFEEICKTKFGNFNYHKKIEPWTRAALQGKHIYHQEWFTFADDDLRYMSIKLSPAFKNDEVTGLVFLLNDMTRMKETEELYDSLVNTSNDMILKLGPDNRVVFVNSVVENVLGYRTAEVLGCSVLDFVVSDSRDKLQAYYDQVSLGMKLQIEVDMLHRSGKVVPGWISLSPILNENGVYNGSIVMAMDISRLKQAEKELSLKTEMLNAFFQASRDLIFLGNSTDGVLEINKAWKKLLGHEKSEIRGKKFLDIIHPDDLQATHDTIEKIKKGIEGTHFVNRLRTAAGDYRTIEWNAMPMEGNTNLTCGIGRDITDRKAD